MTKLHLNKEFSSSAGRIRYGTCGQGPDVVLTHGTPTSSRVWQDVIPRLSAHYRLHFWDLPGYGASEKFEGQDVRLRSFARTLREFVEHLGLSDYHLVGHDFGAATVLGAHLVEGLTPRSIAVADGVVLTPWGTPFSRHVQQHEKVFAAVPEYVHRAVLEAHLRTAVHHIMPDDLMAALIAPWLGEEGQAAYYRQVGQYDYAYTEELEALYPTMTCPAAILWGEEDRWVDIAEGRRLAAMIPGAQFCPLPDAGHFAMLDAPGLFARELKAWLDQQSPEKTR